MNLNFVLAMLAHEREDDEVITTVGNVPVGAQFRYDGNTYIKTRPIHGHQYNAITHQEELVVYNAQRLLDNGESFSYFTIPDKKACLMKEV